MFVSLGRSHVCQCLRVCVMCVWVWVWVSILVCWCVRWCALEQKWDCVEGERRLIKSKFLGMKIKNVFRKDRSIKSHVIWAKNCGKFSSVLTRTSRSKASVWAGIVSKAPDKYLSSSAIDVIVLGRYMHGLNQVWVSYLAVVDRCCPSH